MSVQAEIPTRSRAAPQNHPVVVVGYDGSAESTAALAIAAEHAGSDGTVVAVHATPITPDWRGPLRDQIVLEAEHAQRRLLAHIQATELGPATIEPSILEGDPVDALLRVAETRKAREIVVGSRGLGRVRAILGSVSHRLLERSEVPVTVVPPRQAQS